jgi:hypothetical protein
MNNENSKNKICKFFLKNNCEHGDQCKFIHDKDVCRNYFFDGKCKKKDCKYKHTQTISKRKPKNTENFTPSHTPSDMNILVGIPGEEKFYKDIYDTNDVIIVPNFLKETNIKDFYNKLLNEIENSTVDKINLWKLWHGDTHLILDDNIKWKEQVPTFKLIIDEIEKYFNMEIKSTRFNLYKDSNDWKPYHHDAAAVKEHIAAIQNFTVGVSLGATREISFENVKTKTTVSIPLINCTAYAFSKDININWKHGVPQIHPDKATNEGRISIIAWGKVKEI